MWLSLGGVHTIAEAENVPEKTSNTHLVISSSGDIVTIYNKTHLFDVNIPGAVSLCESAYVRPGTRLATPVSTLLGRRSSPFPPPSPSTRAWRTGSRCCGPGP